MIPVSDAFQKLIAAVKARDTEKVAVARSNLRVLAAPLLAHDDKPASHIAAMDGYAVRAADLTADTPTRLRVIGTVHAGDPPLRSPLAHSPLGHSPLGHSPLGHSPLGHSPLGRGEAIRVMTGAVMPEGSDQLVIQENVDPQPGTDQVVTAHGPEAGHHIRPQGNDFAAGAEILAKGHLMTAKCTGLAAAAGYSHVMVHRAPKIQIILTGNEIIPAGQNRDGAAAIDAVGPMLTSLFEAAGAQPAAPIYVGDDRDTLARRIASLKAANDMIVTVGGVSVGAKDLTVAAATDSGFDMLFHGVNMRPGKPLATGIADQCLWLGLPGNPVSAFICALIFARPAIDAMMGRPAPLPVGVPLPLAVDLPENGPRAHYMRARLVGEPGARRIDPAADQDSSLLSVLSASDGVLIRPANDSARQAGTPMPFLPF